MCICGVNSDGQGIRFNRPKKLTWQAYGQHFVSLSEIKSGGIDTKIKLSISINVTRGCDANTNVVVSRTAESQAHKQHKNIK
jgi:hypothetical protein